MQFLQEELHPESPSRLWSLILLSVAVISVLHSLYIWLVYLFPKQRWRISKQMSVALYRLLRAYPRATADSADPNTDLRSRSNSEALRCPRLLLVVTLVLMCAQIVLATAGVPYVFRLGPKEWVGYIYFVGPAICFGFLLMTAVLVSMCPGVNNVLRILAWVGAIIFCGLWLSILPGYTGDDRSVFFFTYRMSHPGNTVSPGVPVLLLLGALFAWGFMLLARRATVPPPMVPALSETRRLALRLDRRLAEITPWRSLILAFAVVVLWGSLFRGLFQLRSIETRSYDYLILFLLALCGSLLFATWMQLLDAWTFFRRFLESLERHPMREAFSRIPKELASLPLFERERQKVDLFTSARCGDTADALLGEFHETQCAPELPKRVAIIHFWMCKAQRQLAAGLLAQPAAYGKVSEVSNRLEQSVLATANYLGHCAQREFWREGASESLDRETGDREPKEKIGAPERKRILTEEFIALRFVMYVRHVLRQMRSLLWFVVIDFILTVLALSSYPFQSRRLVTGCCVGVLLVVGVGVAVRVARLVGDPLLSRLQESKPNEIGMPFYLRLASFGALPLLTVLATQFPSIGQFLSGWLQPALEALR